MALGQDANRHKLCCPFSACLRGLPGLLQNLLWAPSNDFDFPVVAGPTAGFPFARNRQPLGRGNPLTTRNNMPSVAHGTSCDCWL